MYGVSCIFGIFFMIEKSRDLCQCYQSYLKIWDNVAMKGKKYILETENYLYPLVKSDTDINIFFSQPPASRRWSCQSHYRFLTIFFFYSLDGSCAPPVFRVSICRNAHVIMWSVLLAFIEPSARTTLHAQLLENEEQDGGGRSKFARPAGKSQGKLKERGRKYSKTNRQRSGWTEVLLDESVLISNVYLVENKPGPVSKLRLRLAHKLKYHMC